MKWSSEWVTPLQVVFLRVLFGFIPIVIYALYRKALRFEHLAHTHHFFVMSLLATVIYYYGFVQGSSLLYSGIAGAISGTIPLFSFIMALIFLREEKPNFWRLSGIIVGLVGVILLVNPFKANTDSANIEGVLYMVMGAASVGASFIYAKKYIVPLHIPPIALVSYQLAFALIGLALFTNFDHIENIFIDTHTAWGMVIGLGILGTGVAYLLYYYLIDQLGAVIASSSTYTPPVVALIIGGLFVGEDIKFLDVFASGLILSGVVLLNRQKQRAS